MTSATTTTTMASTLPAMSSTVAMTTPNSSIIAITYNNTTTTTYVSEAERLRYLEELQDETTLTMIPALILLIILAVTGLIGNSMVLFVYSRRFKRTSTRVLIMAIAVFDLIANVIGIPGEIYDMFHIWDFDNPPLCRARLFINAFSVLSSAMVLLAVAVVRYRKVCAPYHWQVTIKQAKIISVCLTCLGILFSLPYAIINGRQTRETPRPDIYGYECTTDDSYVDTIWPVLNNGFFLFLFVVCCVPFTVLYILIGAQAYKHSKLYGSSAEDFHAKSTYVSNSSTTEQPRKISKKRSTKSKVKKTKSKDSIDATSVGFGSIADIMEQYNHDDVKPDSADQYTVRIFNDTVEIRTPMMGEFIVELKNASDNQGFVHDYEVFEYKGDSNETKSGTGGSVRNGEYENIGRGDMKVLDADNLVTSSSENEAGNECGTYNNEIPHDIATTDHSPVNELEHENGNDSVQKFGSAENISAGTMVTSNYVNESVVTVDPASEKGSAASENTIPDIDIDDEASETKPDIQDAVAALKWVDIIYCPEEDNPNDKIRDSKYDGTKCNTPFSLRIPANNIVVQKTEWLRNVLADAVTKAKTKKKPEEPKEQTAGVGLEMRETPLSTLPNGSDDIFDRIEPCSDVVIKTGEDTGSVLRRLRKFVGSVNKTKSRRARRRPLGRTTAMLIIISAVYTLGFLPFLGLMFFKISSPDEFASLTMVQLSFYNLFLRFYFLNCAANPIIYSLCDVSFRRECVGLCRSLPRRFKAS